MERFYTDCIYGQLDAGFNASEAAETAGLQALDNLCQLMFDPENQPPQYSREDAWKRYLEIRKEAKERADAYVASLQSPQDDKA